MRRLLRTWFGLRCFFKCCPFVIDIDESGRGPDSDIIIECVICGKQERC